MASPLRLPILWALAVADVTTTLIIPGAAACQFQAVNHSTYCFGCCLCHQFARVCHGVFQFAWVCCRMSDPTMCQIVPAEDYRKINSMNIPSVT